jgi:glycosyltransferase involved in cell wall biosynthesis
VSQASSDLSWPRVSVVVPTLNEAKNLPYVFSRLPADIHEVIVVDGHSVDDTITVARQLWPDVLVVQQTRRGKGNALACGFEAATGDVIAMVDADGSADPGEIPKFVDALLSGADFAKGTRFAAGGGSSDITRLRKLGNRMLGAAVNLCHGTHYSDLCYGYNVFWQKYVPVLGLDITSPPSPKGDGMLWGDGFEIETLIHMRVADAGLRVAEVPSFEHPRIHGVSNLDAFSDGLRVLTTILVERRRARSRHRPRRRASGIRTAVVLARGLIQMETALMRTLYLVHSIEHGRPCILQARSPVMRPRTASRIALTFGRSHRRTPALPAATELPAHVIDKSSID